MRGCCGTTRFPTPTRTGAFARDRDVDDGRRSGGRRPVEVRRAAASPSGRRGPSRPWRATLSRARSRRRPSRRLARRPRRLRLDSHSDGSAITVMAAATASRRWSVRSNLNTVPPARARTRSGPKRGGLSRLGIDQRERKAGGGRAGRFDTLRGQPAQFGDESPDVGHPGRAVRRAPVGDRRQVRAVGLDEQPFERARGRPRPGRRWRP